MTSSDEKVTEKKATKPRANILGTINRSASRTLKNTYRSLAGAKPNEEYAKYSNVKLIQLLTHSLPGSDRANQVLIALNEKINNLKDSPTEDKQEFHKELATTTKSDIYGKSESVLTAAARYGHQEIVNKLLEFDSQVKEDSGKSDELENYKSFRDYEIKKGPTGGKHSLNNYINADGEITAKQKQRKFYNSEKLAAAAAISAITISTGGIAGAGFAVAGVGLSAPAIIPMISSIAASACSGVAAAGVSLGAAFSSIAASSGITGVLIAAGNILSGAATSAATAVGAPLGLAGVGASGQAIAGGATIATAAGTGVFVGNKLRQQPEIVNHDYEMKDGKLVTTDPIAVPKNGKNGVIIEFQGELKPGQIQLNFQPLLDKNNRVLKPEVLEVLEFNNQGKIISTSYYETNGVEPPKFVKKPENCKSAYDQNWVKKNQDLNGLPGTELPHISSIINNIRADSQKNQGSTLPTAGNLSQQKNKGRGF